MKNSELMKAITEIMEAALTTSPTQEVIGTLNDLRKSLFDLASINYPALALHIEEYLPPCSCGGDICKETNAVAECYKEQFQLIREIIEPHKPRILTLLKKHIALRKQLETVAKEHGL